MKAAFLLIVCMLTLLTVMNSAEATTALINYNDEAGLCFWALGEYCDIGNHWTERFGWTLVSSYWGAVIGSAAPTLGASIVIGIGVGL